MKEALNVLNKVKSAGSIAGTAGKVVKVIAPVIESPVSFRNYQNLLSEDASTTDKFLVNIGAVGDAVSFGFAKSILKTPTLIELIPGDISVWPDSQIDGYTEWINDNINGIKAGDVIFGRR